MSTKFFSYLERTPPPLDSRAKDIITKKSIPSPDHVLCSNKNGEPTAIYGCYQWDMNPVRLSARKIAVWRFDKTFSGQLNSIQTCLLEEMKYLMFCLMKYAGGGYAGPLSTATLSSYFVFLRSVARFCYAQIEHPFIGALTFEQLLSKPAYIDILLKNLKTKVKDQLTLLSLLNHFSNIPVSLLGFKPVSDLSEFDFASAVEKSQHPVIPTGLYLKQISILETQINHIEPFLPDLERFISAFKDRLYGLELNFQEQTLKLAPFEQRPCFSEAVEWHYLTDFFVGDYECRSRKNLSRILTQIQYIIKYTIHTYTGMRDQEVSRLPYDCIHQREVPNTESAEAEATRKAPLVIDIISTTTKFTGYQVTESWLAPTEVIRAVSIARTICRALAKLYKVSPEDLPLFASPTILKLPSFPVEVSLLDKAVRPKFFDELVIHQVHLDELLLSDPTREFSATDGFAVGLPCPLTSHQLRRSLAYYASSSGFVSLPTLSKQFKHLALQMTKYYSNHFDNIKSIFGCYDPETNTFIIPTNHFMFEFQLAIPIHTAYELISAVLSETEFMGGTGVQINKQRDRLSAGKIIITDLRAETQKRVDAGEISHRRTFLGACTKVGDCNEYMLGNVLPCTTCDGSIIHPDSLNAHIASLEEERSQYSSDSGEYQVLTYEITSLQAFAKKGPKQ